MAVKLYLMNPFHDVTLMVQVSKPKVSLTIDILQMLRTVFEGMGGRVYVRA